MIVAYQGERGAFGEEACIRFLPDHERLACASFAAVAEAVAAGRADRGMLPIENSSAGRVKEVETAIEAHALAVVDRNPLPVRMHLMAIPGAAIEQLRAVASHRVALAQCQKLIESLGLPEEMASNTAIAARDLAASGDRTRAVLASQAAADAYGLEILVRDVHDRPDNQTIFAIVRKAGS